MYFDTKVLTKLYKVEENDLLEVDRVKDEYDAAIGELIYKVLRVYLTNKSIPKPRVKGIMDLLNVDFENTSAIEATRLMTNALKVAVNFESFQTLVTKTIDNFNNILFQEKSVELTEEELTDLENYINEIKSNIEGNEDEFDSILEKIEEQGLLDAEDGDEESQSESTEEAPEQESIPELTDSPMEPEAPVQETPVESTPVEPVAETPAVEAPAVPDVREVTQDEILTPVEEPKPTLPPTSDLPERKISVGTELEASKPVSFSR